jgi:hypothetical protein
MGRRGQGMQSFSLPIFAIVTATVLASPAFGAPLKSLPPAAVGGVKPGMTYAEVERRLLQAGFKSIARHKDEFCGYSEQCKLPETEACAGTGKGSCSYRFIKNGRVLQVKGRGETEGNPLGQQIYFVGFLS